jgi:hypothetical protein
LLGPLLSYHILRRLLHKEAQDPSHPRIRYLDRRVTMLIAHVGIVALVAVLTPTEVARASVPGAVPEPTDDFYLPTSFKVSSALSPIIVSYTVN